ncbi:Arm DNA-binding domain-containing protein [Geobacter grbiciae]|uniref:Arm DNA-binding domain-containing protein n=1 Tax=Geobacter grbiciae TaxID=155042 RepID=UPI001C01DD02|nr:tyrosine-type recombinase/integrase [Geobacter grbiciae]MBT1074409.1 tyrosine-type recombinase/integrase [Geobacter grbiciae]
MKRPTKTMNLETLDVKPLFGSIVKMKRSTFLYVDIYYHERRVRMSSGLDDTRENREKLTKFLNKVGEKIEQRTFCFAEAFPGADNELKRFFAGKEQRQILPEPEHVIFGQYTKRWLKDVLPRFSAGKRDDYQKDIEYRLLPFFSKLPFARITGVKLREFVDGLVWKDGKNKGQPLSPHRKRNILIPLKAIWEDACDEYQWELRDPFRAAKKRIREDAGQKEKKEREIFLFDEWQRFLDNMDSFYHPVTEIMLMTGMIASEILGLRKTDISVKYIHVRSSVVKGKEKGTLKTQYRKRDIPITAAIRQRLMAAMSASKSEYVFTMQDGSLFDFGSYRKVVWNRALTASRITNKVPYSARHSLAEWSLLIGVNPVRLVELMGHGNKKMIFEVYGRYREGLVEEKQQILDYLGEDFLNPEKASALATHSETFSETQGPDGANRLKAVGF